MASRTSALAPAKASLFSLTEDLNALDELLTESGGELTDEINAWLAEYALKMADKVDGLGWFWRTIEARIAGFKKGEAELTAKRKTEENKLARLKAYVHSCMTNRKETALAGEVYTLAIQRNGSRALTLQEPFLSHPELLPEAWRTTRIVVEANMEAIRAALAEPGVGDVLTARCPDEDSEPVTVAVLQPAGTHVRLR